MVDTMQARICTFFRLPSHLDVALIARGLASLAVVWWHVVGYQAAAPLERIFTPSGRYAVWVFFALSGYLMGLSFISKRYRFNGSSLSSYFLNRWLRIWPLFAVVSVFSLGFAYFRGEAPALSFTFFTREFFMLQGIHAYSLNGVFWTLGVEAQFYFVLPVIVFALLKSRKPLLCGVMFYILLAVTTETEVRDQLFPWMTSDSRDLLGNLMHFQAGILIALIRPRLIEKVNPLVGWPALVAWATAVISLFMLANFLYFSRPASFFSWRGAVTVDAFAILVLGLHVIVESRRVKIGAIGTTLLILGVLSYGLYCWHGALWPIELLNGRFWPLLSASLVVTILSYWLLERPLLSFKRRV